MTTISVLTPEYEATGTNAIVANAVCRTATIPSNTMHNVSTTSCTIGRDSPVPQITRIARNVRMKVDPARVLNAVGVHSVITPS